jgi:GNAT superfamily N-acetyltransferase
MRPTDLPARERIIRTAFSNGLRPYIYPNGTTEADLIHNYTDVLKTLETKLSTSDTQAGSRCYVAYDDATASPESDFEVPECWDRKDEVSVPKNERGKCKRIVGVAIWTLQPTQLTATQLAEQEEEKEKDKGDAAGGNEFSPSANMALLTAFRSAMTATAKLHIKPGEPHLYLKIIAIDPSYQRKGVGSALLDTGLAVADRLNIKAYLEATPVGRALYERYGWRDVGWLEGFDVRDFGGREEHRFMCMVRPAPAVGDSGAVVTSAVDGTRGAGVADIDAEATGAE